MRATTAGCIIALALVLPACASGHRGSRSRATVPLRLCVENQTGAYGNIIAHAGPTRFDVMPGETVCHDVLLTQASMVLSAVTSAGGANGPLQYSTRLQTGGSRCWRWRLTDSPASAVDLTPC